MSATYEAVIGLEVHAQLATQTKIFCSCPAKPAENANIHICPVCSGQPGALPAFNAKAVEYAVMAGLALQCEVRPRSIFARKNYFYPDLPKGYQISQYDKPICENGFLEIAISKGAQKSTKKIRIKRIHLEEDAGKNIHLGGYSLVNLNRAGVPLVEIVTEPDLSSSEEAGAYLRGLHGILTFLNICDGNLQEGNFRCDANVSVRLQGDPKLGTRAEIKNVNSFRFIEDAIDYEIRRQIETLKAGKAVVQETRSYDPARHATAPLRSKEEAEDYRYFPDPDLMPLVLPKNLMTDIQKRMPELPRHKRERYIQELGLPVPDAWSMTATKEVSHFFESCVEAARKSGLQLKDVAKPIANWVSGEVLRLTHEAHLELHQIPLQPSTLVNIVKLAMEGTVSSTGAKQILEVVWKTGEDPQVVMQREGLAQMSDASVMDQIVEKIIAAYPDQVAEYKAGKQKVMAFLVGQVMKASQGRANPSLAQQLLRQKI